MPITEREIVEAAKVAVACAVRCVGDIKKARYVALAAVLDIHARHGNRTAIAEAVGFSPGRPCFNAVSNCLQYRRYGPRWWREDGGETYVEFVKTELRESALRAARKVRG